MLNLNKESMNILGKIIRSGALRCDIEELCQVLEFVKQKCEVQENDDLTTKVFKLFIVYGKITDICGMVELKQTEISDILFYKRCSDIKLTLWAKYIYSISGTKFCNFLKKQVEVILEKGDIDVKQEYLEWRKEIFKEELENGSITLEEIIRARDKIEFE